MRAVERESSAARDGDEACCLGRVKITNRFQQGICGVTFPVLPGLATIRQRRYSRLVRHKKPNGEPEAKRERRSSRIECPPRSKLGWATHTTVRKASGREWTMLMEYHKEAREAGGKWPTLKELHALVHGKFPELHSQTVQQCVDDFYENIGATTAKRKAQALRGEKITAEYPHEPKEFREVVYTNQAAKIVDGFLCLSNGKVTKSRKIKLPDGFILPGRLMEVKLGSRAVHLVYELPLPEKKADEEPVAAPPKKKGATDLGVNSGAAVYNGEKAVVLNGRKGKSIVRDRNRDLAHIQELMARCTKGSIRWTRLNRRKAQMLAKNDRRVTDYTHKLTARIKEEFPDTELFVGKAFNEAASGKRPKQAQMIASAPTGKITKQILYKMEGSSVIPEPNTSRTCPGCLRVHTPRKGRVFRCTNKKCKLVLPRDVVGAMNILSLGLYGEIRKQPLPTSIVFVRPVKYPGGSQGPPARSGGTPASRSLRRSQCVTRSARSLVQ